MGNKRGNRIATGFPEDTEESFDRFFKNFVIYVSPDGKIIKGMTYELGFIDVVDPSYCNWIKVVQGKYKMGGTGALRFCGKHNLQLIISKRDPQIAQFEEDETKDYWEFTIVRREDPQKGMKSSVFKYLAPEGKILRGF